MSLRNLGGIVNIGTYNDHSREYNIDARGRDLSAIIRACEAEDVTPADEPASTEEVISQTPRGRKTQYLFSDASGNEDTSRTAAEAERVRRYVADHKMGNMQLDSQFTNRLNLLVACFWYRWNERDWVGDEPQGAAIYRFFTEQCGLECAVLPKAFSTKICKIISAGKKDPEIYANLDSYFRE